MAENQSLIAVDEVHIKKYDEVPGESVCDKKAVPDANAPAGADGNVNATTSDTNATASANAVADASGVAVADADADGVVDAVVAMHKNQIVKEDSGTEDEDDDDDKADVAEAPAPKRARTDNPVDDCLASSSKVCSIAGNMKPNVVCDMETASGSGTQARVPSTIALPKPDTILRKFHRIPVFVVDYHNDVLEFLYRCLGSRHLPLENNILVHFDSHPDMVISREVPASASYDKETMLSDLSIENWIMPACYAGHFNRVVWLKNSWCKQLPIGTHKFKIGENNNRINVDLPLDYFVSEGSYCEAAELQHIRDIELQVHDTDNDKLDPNDFLKASDGSNFILDIDLDFFSTSNPFLEIYKDANCYEQLKGIFHFETLTKDSNFTLATQRRQQQLKALKDIFTYLEEHRTIKDINLPSSTIIAPDIIAKLVHLIKTLQACYPDEEIDWMLIYDSGSTTDTNGLPHHVSTPAELETYFEHFKRFLKKLPVPPVAITMACSAEDDYCPQNQVNFIQDRVLLVLTEVFGDRLHEKPILHYMDDEWDIMQL